MAIAWVQLNGVNSNVQAISNAKIIGTKDSFLKNISINETCNEKNLINSVDTQFSCFFQGQWVTTITGVREIEFIVYTNKNHFTLKKFSEDGIKTISRTFSEQMNIKGTPMQI